MTVLTTNLGIEWDLADCPVGAHVMMGVSSSGRSLNWKTTKSLASMLFIYASFSVPYFKMLVCIAYRVQVFK